MGYPCETHQVQTLDGYQLEMHRIPYSDSSPPYAGKPAVYLQHGLLCSSADWVMGERTEKFLGYVLADAGYDVWLGNYRGNTYSRNHVILDPDSNDFWEFCHDQHGSLDVAAQIDAVITETGLPKIHYVGHSMGTTGFMVLMNERPEYEDKIIMANLLAPVAYVANMVSPIKFVTPFVENAEWIATHLGDGEFLPSGPVIDWLADHACDSGWTQIACESLMFLLMGFDEAQMNDTLLPTIVSHSPAGASIYDVLHYGQEYGSQGFNHYDRFDDNDIVYGTPTPPPYYTNLTVPISLYWGDNDWLAAPPVRKSQNRKKGSAIHFQ